MNTQVFFKLLHKIALRGMNYGGGGHLTDSGELSALHRLARLWPTSTALHLIDAGANIGTYSIALATTFKNYPQTKIWALEPAAGTYAKLEKHLQESGFKDRILPRHLGLGRTEEDRTFYSAANAEQSGLASVYPRRLDHFGVHLENKETVHLLPLDTFCEREHISHIHFLKLDLEGHELAALEGSIRLLKNGAIDAIQFEFGGCNIDSRTYFQDFYYSLASDYALYRILRHGLYPITQYKEEQEVFITTNYLAVRKTLGWRP
jgi:FkbM family methyltransferase